MKKYLYIFLIIVFAHASFFSSDNDANLQKEIIHYKRSVNLAVKEKINQIFNNFKNQSVVTGKDLEYYRPDPLYVRPPRKFYIWTRASVVSIDGGKFYYIIPEGFRIVYERSGEIYIDYRPTRQLTPLIINMNNY